MHQQNTFSSGQYCLIVFVFLSLLVSKVLQASELPATSQNSPAAVHPASSTMAVMAYYTGDGSDLGRYNINQLTHIIYSFLHLRGDQLSFDDDQAKIAVKRLVALKQANPQLKVLISMGGWGGCETCSEVFSNNLHRVQFAKSVSQILQEYQLDGVDLDWEYPALPSIPGHRYSPEDKNSFTALVQVLRKQLGKKYEISFAAGGSNEYLSTSIDWQQVAPVVDHINLMSYDLVNGNTLHTGHHTALYSTENQQDSTDNGVKALLRLTVPPEKIIIGAAFYARLWRQVHNINNGLYQAGVPAEGYDFRDYATKLAAATGFKYFWDERAQAAYAYNAANEEFVTFDDPRSLREKVRYIKRQHLGGVMFWQLSQDNDRNELVDTLYQAKITPE